MVEPVTLSPMEIAAFTPNWKLRQMVRRPSKIKRLAWALETIALSYWHQFLDWRKGSSANAEAYRSLEFGTLFVMALFLFEYCVVLFCKGVR